MLIVIINIKTKEPVVAIGHVYQVKSIYRPPCRNEETFVLLLFGYKTWNNGPQETGIVRNLTLGEGNGWSLV